MLMINYFKAIRLPFELPPLLAVGGELKSAFCLATGNQAFMSPQFGDMSSLETLRCFEDAFSEMKQSLKIEPEIIACDMHPAYLSTRWAQAFARERDLALIPIQHHHAHIAAVMAEHNLNETVLGISFDGTGYGIDGAIWGGEILQANYSGFKRLAYLKYLPLAGGDVSIKKPYRMALAHLWAAGIAWDEDLPPVQACSETERGILRQQFERNINTVQTSSMGRLFDAVASLIGVRQIINYEAQAALEMQALLAPSETAYCFAYEGEQINPAPVLKALIEDMRAGISKAVIAGRFHRSILGLILDTARKQDVPIVILSGGVFQNRYLLELGTQALESHGYRVFFHKRLPINDASLALGQATILAHQAVTPLLQTLIRVKQDKSPEEALQE
jgi:hydrogenase maturation protein HypF